MISIIIKLRENMIRRIAADIVSSNAASTKRVNDADSLTSQVGARSVRTGTDLALNANHVSSTLSRRSRRNQNGGLRRCEKRRRFVNETRHRACHSVDLMIARVSVTRRPKPAIACTRARERIRELRKERKTKAKEAEKVRLVFLCLLCVCVCIPYRGVLLI